MDKELKELLKSQMTDAYYQVNEPELVEVMKDCIEKDYISPKLLPLMQSSLTRQRMERQQFVEAHRC